MALKDYYLILGVPRDESPYGIRAAYRDLVKQHHPDAAGGTDSGRFRELAEAYEVLSDPERRRYYDHDLEEAERPSPPYIPRKWESEPPACRARSIFDGLDWSRPSIGGFGGADGLNIEVVLTPAEAVHGGTLPVTIPVFQRCRACGGTGEEWPFPCNECRAQGITQSRTTVRVAIPPHAAPGTVIELPLRGSGIRDFYLRVHVLIAGR